MDKNHGQEFDQKIMSAIHQNSLTLILADESFAKIRLLEKIIDSSSDIPVFYVDFDLLYSGLIQGEIISKNDRVHLYRPEHDELQYVLDDILHKISHKKSLVIIDSLNGFYNIFDEKDAGRLANSCMMLMSMVGKHLHSQIIITSKVIKKDGKVWVLAPSGRQVMTAKSMTSISLKTDEHGTIASLLNSENIIIESTEI